MIDSNVCYIPANSKFVRGHWRVWCFDEVRKCHYWGFPGDPNLVKNDASRRFRKVHGPIITHTMDIPI